MSSKPAPALPTSRSRTASTRLRDDNNSEAPSAVHQVLLEQTQTRLKAGEKLFFKYSTRLIDPICIPLANVIAKLIKSIENLSHFLPDAISEGTEDDEIHRVLTTVHGHDPDSVMSTFNRRFDILFKEDASCRKDGRLHLIRRGEFGMMMVVDYLRGINWSAPEMQMEIAKIKLERIVTEMEFIWCVMVICSRG